VRLNSLRHGTPHRLKPVPPKPARPEREPRKNLEAIFEAAKPNVIPRCSIMSAICLFSAGFIFLAARETPAQSAELRVMISDGMKPVVEELTPQIEHATGRKLAAQFNSSKFCATRFSPASRSTPQSSPLNVLDDLSRQGKIASGSGRENLPHGNGCRSSRRSPEARHRHARGPETHALEREIAQL